MSIQKLLVLSLAAVGFSANVSYAGSCMQDVDRAWAELGPKMQARIGAGRSAPQSVAALHHYQPTPNSIAAAEEKLGERWLPMEMAVMALARAREADRLNDKGAGEQALSEAQSVFFR
jgi:hypothetical protein